MPDDCRPNKALRTTIKVFLKKKVMERETARKKEAVDKVSATPAPPATALPDQTSAIHGSETSASSSAHAVVGNNNANSGSGGVSQNPQALGDAGSKIKESVIPTDAQKDIPQESIEVKSITPVKSARD